MEEMQIENLKTVSFCLRPRRHLQSETYRTLVRIFSHCYDESQHSATPHVQSELHTVDGINKLLKEAERRGCEPVQLVGTDDKEPAIFTSRKITEMNLSSHDNGNEHRRSSDTRMAIDQIEQLMDLEGTESSLNQMDLAVYNNAFAGSQNVQIGGEQTLIDELKHILEGNESLAYDTVVNAASSDPKQENEGHSTLKSLVLNTDPVTQPKEMEIENSVSARDTGNNTISGVPEIGDIVEKQRTSPNRDRPRKEHETECKDKELKRSVQTCDVMNYANYIDEDEGIEEGEISGDYRASDDSMDLLLQDAVVSKDKQASEAFIEKKEFPYNKANQEGLESCALLMDINDSSNNGRIAKFNENDRIMVSIAKTAVSGINIKADRLDGYEISVEGGKVEKKDEVAGAGARANKQALLGQALEEDATRDHQITLMEDDKVRKEKKRGPPSKERRAKKKLKERKKRAEKNRQLGVKRLKLPPISKPKAVTHCRHYIMGRCHEGDKCKFSHDTVPLTKSKACCHFARHSCMKGDDCPFDHQLSKYPCSNFVSNGSCNRGDNCLFSHKMSPKEDVATASNCITPELKRVSLPDISSSRKEFNSGGTNKQNLNALSYFTKIHSLTGSRQSVKVTDPTQSEVASKGTVGNSPISDSNKHKLGVPAPNSNALLKSRDFINENASRALQNSNEKLNRTSPVVAPKGINFVSFGKSPSLFGKAPSDDSSNRNTCSLPMDAEKGAESLHSDKSNLLNQASSAPKSDVTLKGVQPEATPKGINSLLFGKATINESGGKGKFSLPPSGDNSNTSFVQQKRNVMDKSQTSSVISTTPLSSLVSSVSFSDRLASRVSKETSHSAQKALLATLAFAAKYESGMKVNPSIGSPVAKSDFNKETRNNGNSGGSESGSENAAKILDFLSSIGGSKNK